MKESNIIKPARFPGIRMIRVLLTGTRSTYSELPYQEINYHKRYPEVKKMGIPPSQRIHFGDKANKGLV